MDTEPRRSIPSCAELLRKKKESIIERWEIKVCREIPPANLQTESELRNDLPKFLDRLADVLSFSSPLPAAYAELSDVSEDHGLQRANLGEYSLEQMLAEYRLLREAIFECLEEKSTLPSKDRDGILSFLERGMADAAARFVKAVQRRDYEFHERYRLVTESLTDYAIIRMDREGRITEWNSGAENVVGFKREEVLGKSGSLIFTSEDRARGVAQEEMKTALKEGRAEDQRWHLKKDGSRFFGNGVMNPLFDEQGNHLGFVKVLQDRTLAREAEVIRDNFFDLPDHMLCIASKDGHFKQLNAAWEKTLGWAVQELISSPWLYFVHPEDQEKTIEAGSRLDRGETVVNFRNRYRRKDGRYIWLDWSVRPIGSDLYGVARDVTPRIEALQAMESREHQLRLIADAVPTHLIHIDRDERILFANHAMAEMWRIPLDRVVGRTIREIVGEDAHRELYPYTEKVLRGEACTYEYSFRNPEGVLQTFLNTYTPDRGPDGKVRAFVVTGTDITERKKIEAERAFGRHMLEAIFQESPAAMALWRGSGLVFEMVNPVFQSLFGDVELVGKSFLEALPEFKDQPFADLLNRVFETGESFIGREVLARHRRSPEKEPEDRYYDFTYVRINDADGNPYGIYDHAVDVTERVLARRDLEVSREALQTAVKNLEQERELRERFVMMLTHDLRTPLTAVKMLAQMMERNPDTIPVNRKNVHRIAESLDRMDHMIRDLLDASRIRAGERIPIEFSECDVGAMLRDTLDELSAIHGDRFTLRVPEPVVGFVSCEGTRRIVENLCNNAVKYGSKDRRVTVAAGVDDEEIEISVHNWGKPIPSVDLDRLFDPYRRAMGAETGGEKGWGLGLTLVKGIAQAQGGRVSVRSVQEEGTTFTVRLPVSGFMSESP